MRNFHNLSDEDLIELLRDENELAFEEIYNRYWEKLYIVAYKRTGSKEAAEELVQDLFTSLWMKRKGLYIGSTVAAYLQGAMRYKVFDHYQKEFRQQIYQESASLTVKKFDNTTEETVLLKDLVNNIESEVKLLPSKCRSVYELSRKEYKTNKEIAASLGISEKTVENHLTKALKRIKISLSDITAFFTL